MSKIKDQQALDFHAQGKPGKLEISPTKSLATQRELALAYSPGVAVPCLRIQENPDHAYDYTAKGNLVAVVSNGTAVLGLGNLGALASKPVMEGKAVLFKRFADIDGFDIEIDTEDVDQFVQAVETMAPTFGGINLEDIKAPECFVIEERLKEKLKIPVFHDDQHGTAICVVAGLINAFHLTGRDFKTAKVVVNGAGAAAVACSDLVKAMGLPHDNLTMVDRTGVIYEGRSKLNPWKERHATKTKTRTLEEALKGADVVLGLSAKGAVTKKMVASMNDKPIIFAMANPDPEILPEDVHEVRSDAIVATGRSDYPNQVNNALCFPYLFRGALDVHAEEINDAMKIAAAEALAELAREEVHEDVVDAYAGKEHTYGADYIIPVPFDPRLISAIPPAVAKAAMQSGVARKPIEDIAAYEAKLRGRRDVSYSSLSNILVQVKENPKRIIFSEGEEEKMIRAAINFHADGLGHAILVGREDVIRANAKAKGFRLPKEVKIYNAKLSDHNQDYIDFLYEKLQRKGFLYRDCQRLIHQDRHYFSACMVALGHADGMVTGLTRNYTRIFDSISSIIDAEEDAAVFGLSILLAKSRTLFIADTTIHESPSAETLAKIAIQSAEKARSLGHNPRVAFLSYSNFGNPTSAHTETMRQAVAILDQQNVDFEYEGEMSAAIALQSNESDLYPFNRLSGPANVLIMPDLHSAHISSQLLQELAGGTMMGPILIGLKKPVQIAQMTTASASDLVNLAVLSAHHTL